MDASLLIKFLIRVVYRAHKCEKKEREEKNWEEKVIQNVEEFFSAKSSEFFAPLAREKTFLEECVINAVVEKVLWKGNICCKENWSCTGPKHLWQRHPVSPVFGILPICLVCKGRKLTNRQTIGNTDGQKQGRCKWTNSQIKQSLQLQGQRDNQIKLIECYNFLVFIPRI